VDASGYAATAFFPVERKSRQAADGQPETRADERDGRAVEADGRRTEADQQRRPNPPKIWNRSEAVRRVIMKSSPRFN
jgi:hypothetical protein